MPSRIMHAVDASMEPSLISEGNLGAGRASGDARPASMEPSLISEGNASCSSSPRARSVLQWSPR